MVEDGSNEKEINKKIQGMILDKLSCDEVIKYVKEECQRVHLKPLTLGMLFERYVGIDYDDKDAISYFSKEIKINDLTENIHPDFKTSNGNTWARSNTSYLGKKYIINRPQRKGKVFAVSLEGPNYSHKGNRNIKKEIWSDIKRKNCVILGIGEGIEVDHKNGKYDNLDGILPENQSIDDFQPLSKAANIAKRTHCKKCNDDGKRYDARLLGYKEGWIRGDENTISCVGCYWYDPKTFNQEMTKDYEKVL